MRIGRLVAFVATIIGGLITFGVAPSMALPIGPGATPGITAEGTVEQAQYYYRGPVYRSRPVYRPAYGYRRVYRAPVYSYRPIRRPRVVCSTRFRVVATPYGYVRRPVRVCRRIY